MRPGAALRIVVALVLLAPCAHAAPTSMGVLTGSVTKGPLSPVERPGMSSGSVVSGAPIDIGTLDGKLVTSVETDSAGTFRVDLPAATYKVTMPSLYGAMFSKDLPAVV